MKNWLYVGALALSPARVGYDEQEEKGTDQEIKKDVTKHQETTYASTVKDSIRAQIGTPDKGHD
ncbi:hypothetical protein [Lysinibacillus sphaericus]|uniref:hypothetical protein n=1 Tax=Lysinibacillus sphaericus TaxID=1421 RepID=UPI0004DF97F0|nr:hypothetical protein [Lysinibacillus sphaericus]QPA59772.1 hypothetical protein INQ55_05180 [Lysinibacillus sphaericus]